MLPADAKRFVTAPTGKGKAIFTIEPTAAFLDWFEAQHPGKLCQPHYTYKINCKAGKWNGQETLTYFIALLTGPDNTEFGDYTYMGLLNPDDLTVKLTDKSNYKDDSPPVIVLRTVLQKLAKGVELPPDAIRHEGRCGRCGRPLTVPESIDRGIGPECWERLTG